MLYVFTDKDICIRAFDEFERLTRKISIFAAVEDLYCNLYEEYMCVVAVVLSYQV